MVDNFAEVGTTVGHFRGKPLGTRVAAIVDGVRVSDGKKVVTVVGFLEVGRTLGKGVGLTLGETDDSMLGAKVGKVVFFTLGLALKIALGTAEEEMLGFTDMRALGK